MGDDSGQRSIDEDVSSTPIIVEATEPRSPTREGSEVPPTHVGEGTEPNEEGNAPAFCCDMARRFGAGKFYTRKKQGAMRESLKQRWADLKANPLREDDEDEEEG